jgi:hypothetical protein
VSTSFSSVIERMGQRILKANAHRRTKYGTQEIAMPVGHVPMKLNNGEA